MIFRDIQTKVEHALSQQLVAIVYGARQTGKNNARQADIYKIYKPSLFNLR